MRGGFSIEIMSILVVSFQGRIFDVCKTFIQIILDLPGEVIQCEQFLYPSILKGSSWLSPVKEKGRRTTGCSAMCCVVNKDGRINVSMPIFCFISVIKIQTLFQARVATFNDTASLSVFYCGKTQFDFKKFAEFFY